jgi:membrane associated rhomboid family serine protease
MSNYYAQSNPSFQFNAPRMTWAVHRLLLLNVAIFSLQLVADPIQYFFFADWTNSGQIPGGVLNTWFGFQPDLFWTYFLLWKPFTYMFLHGGLLHIFMNMLWLFFFGPDVERTLGSREFVRFYLICGAVAVLTTTFRYVLAGDAPSVVGASGSVMAVMMAFAILFPDRQFFLFPLPFPLNARALVLIVVVLNVISGLQGGGSVSVATHLGGIAMGYAYMKALPAIQRYRREKRWKNQIKQKKKPKADDPGLDDVGKAVDNIFKFEDRDKR